jgi:GNAT superfamily N-acetyltransferase
MPYRLDQLTHLTPAQAKPAGQMLGRVFHHDPIYTHLMPDEEERQQVVPHILEFLARYGALYGEAYTTSPRLEGIIIWLPFKHITLTPWRMVKAGVLSLHSHVGWHIFAEAQVIWNYSAPAHERHAPFPHWYLFLLGVDPSCQGQGHGRTLLKATLARIDRDGLPCYLETDEAKSVAIYQRYGFEVAEEIPIPDTTLTVWAMVRAGHKRRAALFC